MPTMIGILYQEKWNPSEVHEQSHTPAPETTPQFLQNSYHASSSIAQLLATHLASLQSNRANSAANFQTTHSFPNSNGVGQNGLENFAPNQEISLAGLTNAGVETSVTQTLLRNMNIPLHNITTQNTVTTSANKVQMSTQQLLMNGSPIYTQSKTIVSA